MDGGENTAETGENPDLVTITVSQQVANIVKGLHHKNRRAIGIVRHVRNCVPALRDPIYIRPLMRYGVLSIEFTRLADHVRAAPLSADSMPALDALRRLSDSCSKAEAALGITRAARDQADRPPDAIAGFAAQMQRMRRIVNAEPAQIVEAPEPA